MNTEILKQNLMSLANIIIQLYGILLHNTPFKINIFWLVCKVEASIKPLWIYLTLWLLNSFHTYPHWVQWSLCGNLLSMDILLRVYASKQLSKLFFLHWMIQLLSINQRNLLAVLSLSKQRFKTHQNPEREQKDTYA